MVAREANLLHDVFSARAASGDERDARAQQFLAAVGKRCTSLSRLACVACQPQQLNDKRNQRGDLRCGKRNNSNIPA